MSESLNSAREYAKVVWAESRAILTGSSMALGLSFLGYAGLPVPRAVLVTASAVGVLWATHRAWSSERLQRLSCQAKLLDRAPTVIASYVGPGLKETEERVVVKNSSAFEAFNVEIYPIRWKDVTISFPRLIELGPGQEVEVEPRFDRKEPPFLNRIHSVLMIGFDDIPAEELGSWAAPKLLRLEVRYTGKTGALYRNCCEYEYVWQVKESRLRRIHGVTRDSMA